MSKIDEPQYSVSLFAPIFLVSLGVGLTLHAIGVAGVAWTIPITLIGTAVGMAVEWGARREVYVAVPWLVSAGLVTLLHQFEVISFEVEVSLLVLVFGMSLLLERMLHPDARAKREALDFETES